MRAQNLLK